VGPSDTYNYQIKKKKKNTHRKKVSVFLFDLKHPVKKNTVYAWVNDETNQFLFYKKKKSHHIYLFFSKKYIVPVLILCEELYHD